MIVYSRSTGFNNAAAGKLETPIKMIIERESEKLSSQGGALNALFNVEKSSRYGETIVGTNEFDVFTATEEGGGATSDTVMETYRKFIEHIQFMKEFAISADMMEDATFGIAADAKRRAENFTRAYYKTMNKICECALANATAVRTNFANATIDLTAPDGKALFSGSHIWGTKAGKSGSQSNYYFGNVVGSGTTSERVLSTEIFEGSLYNLSVKMRNMLDENGEPLGYDADTIVLPGNRPALESIVRKVCESPFTPGTNLNDVNLHYGKWRVVVLPTWQANDNRFILMSSEANKALSGNMFFNRVPLTVTNWVDNHTGNYIWNGRCRFGVGFGSYKHAILAVDSAGTVNGATALK